MFFPLYIDLRNKEVLIVGGGKLSSRKANKLVEYGANLTIYSEKIIEEKLCEIENLKFILENLVDDDLLITMGAGDVLKIGENLLGI